METKSTLEKQFEDYVEAMRLYIQTATGVDESRIIFSAPDVAKRKLKEKLTETASAALVKTVEIDHFISFYFPMVQDTISPRSTNAQRFNGAIAQVSKSQGFPIQLDVPVQIEVWGGPDQRSKSFVFEKQMLLKDYMTRRQQVQVTFRDLVTKDPTKPEEPFDVNCWYLIELESITNNSQPEGLYTTGALYRATFDATWMVTFYNMPTNLPLVGKIEELIVEYEAVKGDELAIEVDVTEADLP